MPCGNVLLACLLIPVVYIATTFRKAKKTLPPGPAGIPILGNFLGVPLHNAWVTYQQWGHQYASDIISFKLLGTVVIVLNSDDVARELLDKRSSIYSDRTTTVMLHKLTGWDRNFAFIPYGELWRTHHRYFHQYFNEQVIPQYWTQIIKYPRRLLKRLLDTPGNFGKHIRWMFGAQILFVAYGLNIEDDSDPHLVRAEAALQSVSEIGSTGSYLVDFVPILRYIPAWFPGAGFKRQANEWRKCVLGMYEFPFREVRQRISAGIPDASIAASLLEAMDQQSDSKQYEYVIQNVVGTTFVGGQDTSVSTLTSFCLEMLMNPDVQRAAQAQLDDVIGTERLPEYRDEDSLPLITAILWEVIRMHPAAPLAVPHKTTSEDEYLGYHIPANAVVLINAWAMNYDERVYANPHEFSPYRFLTIDGRLNPDVPKPDALFGFGRRACPGRPFATHTLTIAMAHILATFNINKPLDANGNEVQPSGKYTSGNLLYPLPFEADFQPRSQAAAELIRAAIAAE